MDKNGITFLIWRSRNRGQTKLIIVIISVVCCTREHREEQSVFVRRHWRSKVSALSSPSSRFLVFLSALRKAPVDCWLWDSLNPVLWQCPSHGVNFWQSKINATWCESKYRAVLFLSAFQGTEVHHITIVITTDCDEFWLFMGWPMLLWVGRKNRRVISFQYINSWSKNQAALHSVAGSPLVAHSWLWG